MIPFVTQLYSFSCQKMQLMSDEKVRPVKMRVTFSLRFAFLMMSFAAFAIPAFSLPGGYFLYGPLLVIFVLSVALIAQIRRTHASHAEWTLKSAWKPVAVSITLLLFIICFASLSGIAYEFYTQEQLRAKQLNRIEDIANDPDFVQTALALHKLMLASDGGRHLRGNSELVPKEIGRLYPITVNASQECLTLQLSQSFDRMLIIYSPDSALPRVHGKKIVDNVHYWDRRR